MSVNSISTSAFEPYLRPRTDAADRTRFHVPESPLRRDAARAATPATPSEQARPGDSAAPRDPSADAVELTRDFPALLLPPTYPAPERSASLPAAGQDRRAAGENGGRGEAGASADTESAEEGAASRTDGAADGAANAADGEGAEANSGPDAATGPDGKALADGEQRQLAELKDRDQEVRTHEQAHKAAGGQYAGAISYDYQQGPDGRRYAVGGEVSIDASPEKDPAATIAKMRQVRAAAMAPAEPSPQDRSVAAQAMQQENQARAEERAEAAEDGPGSTQTAGSTGAADGTASTDDAAGTDGNGTAAAEGEGTGGTSPAAAGRTQGEGEVEAATAAALEGAVQPGSSVRALPPARLSMAAGAGYGYGAAAFAGGGYVGYMRTGGVDVFA